MWEESIVIHALRIYQICDAQTRSTFYYVIGPKKDHFAKFIAGLIFSKKSRNISATRRLTYCQVCYLRFGLDVIK